jgi:hypothetical protein
MTTKKKTWVEKRDCGKKPHVKVIDKKFAGISSGAKMLVSSPEEINAYVRDIPKGAFLEPVVMRYELAQKHNADATCPVSTGIFLRITAEAAIEEYQSGTSIEKITPFWRIISLDAPLAKKLSIDNQEFEVMKHLGEKT